MKAMSPRFPVVVMGIFFLLFLRPISAQVSGQISGYVVDQSGSSIPNSTVSLTNDLTSQTRTAKTDTAGSFVFPNLVPGNYSLSATQAGFRRY
jgi:hypothetical protein